MVPSCHWLSASYLCTTQLSKLAHNHVPISFTTRCRWAQTQCSRVSRPEQQKPSSFHAQVLYKASMAGRLMARKTHRGSSSKHNQKYHSSRVGACVLFRCWAPTSTETHDACNNLCDMATTEHVAVALLVIAYIVLLLRLLQYMWQLCTSADSPGRQAGALSVCAIGASCTWRNDIIPQSRSICWKAAGWQLRALQACTLLSE